MSLIFDKLWFGLILGLVAPMLGVTSFYFIKHSAISFGSFIQRLVLINVFAPILSLFVIINLGIFYLFLWKHCYYSARGVIMATFIYAFVVLIIKFTS